MFGSGATYGIGGGVWWALSRLTGSLLTGLFISLVAVVVARAILHWSGRRLERDPYQVMLKLDPRTS